MAERCGNHGGEQYCAAVDPSKCETHKDMPDYWPPLDATDVVRIQLSRIEKAGEVVGNEVTRVGSYSHAANLMHWAYRQKLVNAQPHYRAEYADELADTSKPVSLTPKGTQWLDKFGRRDHE